MARKKTDFTDKHSKDHQIELPVFDRSLYLQTIQTKHSNDSADSGFLCERGARGASVLWAMVGEIKKAL